MISWIVVFCFLFFAAIFERRVFVFDSVVVQRAAGPLHAVVSVARPVQGRWPLLGFDFFVFDVVVVAPYSFFSLFLGRLPTFRL